jgi:hypothetical protein
VSRCEDKLVADERATAAPIPVFPILGKTNRCLKQNKLSQSKNNYCFAGLILPDNGLSVIQVKMAINLINVDDDMR